MRLNRSARIAVNASIVGESLTGLGLYSVKLVRELDRLREDLLIYTSAPETLGALRARVERIPASVRPELGLRGHFMRLVWTQSALRACARAHRIEVLLNTVPEGVLGLPIPQVAVVHDLLPLSFPAEYPRHQYYFRLLVPRILRASRVVVADSESTRQSIIRHYALAPEKIRVIYPGYDPDVYFPDGLDSAAGPDPEGYLLYVGNLLPHKNLLRLLDAVAILRRRTRCRLLIRGHGRPAYVNVVRARVETLGLGEAVTFLDYAGEDALRKLYAGAACLVLPSLGEGFGLPVLEAMACGTPVIASSISSLPEVAGDAALMVDPHDAIALADAMHRVLTDRDLREHLREQGLKRAMLFPWRRTAERISELLDEINCS